VSVATPAFESRPRVGADGRNPRKASFSLVIAFALRRPRTAICATATQRESAATADNDCLAMCLSLVLTGAGQGNPPNRSPVDAPAPTTRRCDPLPTHAIARQPC
jgi:hypothetical protein